MSTKIVAILSIAVLSFAIYELLERGRTIDTGEGHDDAVRTMDELERPIQEVGFHQSYEAVETNTEVEEFFVGNADLARRQMQSKSSVHPKNIVFPDGSVVTVHFTLEQRTKPSQNPSINSLDDGVSGGFFERLSPAAKEGNGDVAVYLANELNKCAIMPKTDAELEQIVQRAKSSQRRYQTDIQFERGSEKLRASRLRCDAVNAKMTDESREHLKQSAESGHVESALMYANSISVSNPKKAAEYYEMSWNKGYLAGAAALGAHYSSAISTHDDRINAFAYMYIAKSATLSLFDGLEAQAVRASNEKRYSELIELERSVPASISEPGIQLAIQLLQENSKCCKL